MKGWFWQQAVKFLNVAAARCWKSNHSIAILPSVNHLKSAIRDIQIWCLQVTMEACPQNTINLTAVYKMICNRWVRVDRLPWLLGLGVGRCTLHRVVTAIKYAKYAIQCISVSWYYLYGCIWCLSIAWATTFDKQIIVQHVCTDKSR